MEADAGVLSGRVGDVVVSCSVEVSCSVVVVSWRGGVVSWRGGVVYCRGGVVSCRGGVVSCRGGVVSWRGVVNDVAVVVVVTCKIKKGHVPHASHGIWHASRVFLHASLYTPHASHDITWAYLMLMMLLSVCGCG